jgi:uncharacterized protein YhhL (DUF1145 family)
MVFGNRSTEMNMDEGLRRLVIGMIWVALLLGMVTLLATGNLILALAVAVTIVALAYTALYVANGFLKKDNETKDSG